MSGTPGFVLSGVIRCGGSALGLFPGDGFDFADGQAVGFAVVDNRAADVVDYHKIINIFFSGPFFYKIKIP